MSLVSLRKTPPDPAPTSDAKPVIRMEEDELEGDLPPPPPPVAPPAAPPAPPATQGETQHEPPELIDLAKHAEEDFLNEDMLAELEADINAEQAGKGKDSLSVAGDYAQVEVASIYEDVTELLGEEGGEELREKQKAEEEEKKVEGGELSKKFLSILARNYYKLQILALVLAFSMNFMLLFYKVTRVSLDDEADGAGVSDVVDASSDAPAVDSDGGEGGSDDDDDDGNYSEFFEIEDNVQYYMSPLMKTFSLIHLLTSFAMLLGYYHLKVPLSIFKREKEICRKLEFEGMWISEQPSEGEGMIGAHWDKLVISAELFPVNYWDKFVKKRVRNKYSEQYDYDAISKLLGMDKDGGGGSQKATAGGFISWLNSVDWRYQTWKFGVILTDSSVQYCLFYFFSSVYGNFWNPFAFSVHLLDIAFAMPALRTIIDSVTHNGKQLLLTVMMTTIVVYIYTVIAFNWFRRFYVEEGDEDGETDYKCHNMLTCFVFHLYAGVRAGGGIGDEIEAPDGSEYAFRMIFDITFFFFVVVILLAIIQGLIIDAFGELRDQLEQAKEDMESNCYICGIGKDYFDKVPHGFETHTLQEHNLANYLFFLMHLINKAETEYTGQETYVWNLYQERCWDFFPVGDCFRKQYEDELTAN